MLNNKNMASPTAYVSVAALEWMIEGAQQYHLNLDDILARCDLTITAKDICTGAVDRISTDSYCKLYYQLNYSLQIEANKAAGARGLYPEEFKMLCYCLITAETLREAMSRLALFFEMLRERFPNGRMYLTEEGNNACYELDWGLGEPTPIKVEMEKKSLFLFYYLFSWMIGRPIPLSRVTLNAPVQNDLPRMGALFGRKIDVGQERHAFYFPTSYLDRPVIRSYSELKMFLELYPSMMLSPVGISESGLAPQLKQIMMNICLKEGGFPSFPRLAELYDISESSLSRRLRRDEISYSSIKEQCQFEIAKEYMWRPELTIADIASLLGFSDANSFSRSFRKWSGHPPATYRKNLLN